MINPHIVRKTVDPSTAPPEAGIHWINTDTGKEFFSVGMDDVSDWVERGVASGVDDTAYNATSWNGVTAIAPSKNAVRDQVEVMLTSIAAKQGSLTVTTTGSSGPSTLIGNTLNIPQYSGGGGGSGDVVGPASSVHTNIVTFDGITGKLIQDGGSTIATVLNRSSHTGSQTASTISDLNSATITFTNKTIDADGTGNSITNIDDGNIKSGAAINAAKIADGSVSSTEFQYINSLSSNAQDQIDGKSDVGHTHDITEISYVGDPDFNDYIVNTAEAGIVSQTITNGDTFSAPSSDVVFDALALKAGLANNTFTGTQTAPRFAISATNGTGTLYLDAQSSNPGAPSSGFQFFADVSGRLSWVRTDGFKRTLSTGTLTADRTYTLPDASGTLFFNSRTINTTAPITGGGDLSADRTIAMPVATASVDGYLSSANFTTFNGKQAALGYTPLDRAGSNSLTGDIANSSTGYFQLASGTTGQRPGSPANGMARYNSSTVRAEFYEASGWHSPVRSDGDTMSGLLVLSADPTAALGAATKQYTDSVATTSSSTKASVAWATTSALPTCTYSNGASGVGATLTGTINGALPSQDGVAIVALQRALIKNQVADLQNGIYVVTQVGTVGTPFILTRSTDADTSNEISGTLTVVDAGSTNIGKGYRQQTVTPVMGTDSIVWVIFFNTVTLAGTGLTSSGNTLSVDTSIIATQTFATGLITTHKATVNAFTKAQYTTPVALTAGTTVALDASLSNFYTLAPAQNFTLSNPTNLAAGMKFTLNITNDSTPRTITFGANYKFAGGTAPALTATAGAKDKLICDYDGTTLECSLTKAFS